VPPGERRCSPWGNVEARDKRPSRRRASSGELKTFSPSSEFRKDKILLVSNEFKYGVKGGRSSKDS